METHPKLFHQSKTNKLYSWQIKTEDADIITEYGTTEGSKSIARKTVKGKNIGKKNETSPEEQAKREAKAMWTKKLEGKYSESIDKAKDTVFLPQLAHDWKKQKKKPKYPYDIQPKLDGVRCLAWRENKQIILMSRGGKKYNVKHIQEELKTLKLRQGDVLDGELYIHGNKLQDTTRLVKKHREGPNGSIKLSFSCYDAFHRTNLETPWKERKILLENILKKTIDSNTYRSVLIVKTDRVHNEEELMLKLAEYEKEGFEGLMIRLDNANYLLGHRSRGLLKLKNFQDAEFEVIGFTESSGNDKGCVIWECKTAEDKTFTVRPIGNRYIRKKWFQNGNDYIGKMLTVKFQALTNNLIPQFPVGIVFREPEDI